MRRYWKHGHSCLFMQVVANYTTTYRAMQCSPGYKGNLCGNCDPVRACALLSCQDAFSGLHRSTPAYRHPVTPLDYGKLT